MRPLELGLVLAACAALLAACGGSPSDASEEDFCAAYEEVNAESGLSFGEGKKVFEGLVDVGTPEDILDEAREGFELLVDIVDEADTEDESLEALEDLDKAEQEKLGAFVTYAEGTCNPPDDSGGRSEE